MVFDYLIRGMQILFEVILPIATICAAIFFYRMWRRQSGVARETLRWPSTRGRIQAAGIAEKAGRDGPMHQAEVEYAYEVNGTAYVGHRINLYPFSCSDRRIAERAVERFAAGSEHPVYYDPEDPASSLLQPGLTWWGRLPLIASISLALGAIVTFLYSSHFNEKFSRTRAAEQVERPQQPAKDR